MVREFFRPSTSASSKCPRHRFARELDPADVAVKHESKNKSSEATAGSRPSSALDRSQSPPSPAHHQAVAAASSSQSVAFGGDLTTPESLTARINWGSTVETSVAAITGGAGSNEEALQRVLAAKRAALMQRLDPDGQYEAAALQMHLKSSPLHNRAISPTKDRSPAAKAAPTLQRRGSVRPASAAACYTHQHAVPTGSELPETCEDNDQENHDEFSHMLQSSSVASPAASQLAASSPAARRLERFASMDAHVTHNIEQMRAHTKAAAAAPGDAAPLPLTRPSSAACSRSLGGNEQDSSDRANRADMYFLQVQVDNSTCGFADRFDCCVMTYDPNGGRRQLTASFPQLLMSKDRYLLFPGKPRMWQGLPTDKVFGSGVARMTDFDPRTVLSLSEYLPWVSQPSQLLGCSLRVQVFSRVKRDNARRCVVDKLITFNTDFTVDAREFPESMKGLRDGQRPTSSARKQRPQSAML